MDLELDYEQECKDAEQEEGQERGGMEAVAFVGAAAFVVGGAVGAAKQTIETFDQTIDSLIKPDDSFAEKAASTLLVATLAPVLLTGTVAVGFVKGGWSWATKVFNHLAK
jgi:hypothetical protein